MKIGQNIWSVPELKFQVDVSNVKSSAVQNNAVISHVNQESGISHTIPVLHLVCDDVRMMQGPFAQTLLFVFLDGSVSPEMPAYGSVWSNISSA